MSRTGPEAGDHPGAGQRLGLGLDASRLRLFLGPASRAGLGRRSMPFSNPVLWYPMLAVLALDEIAEVPIAAAMVLGRLLVSDRPPYPVADRGSGDEA